MQRIKKIMLSLLLLLWAIARTLPAEAAESGKTIVAPLNGTVGVQMEQFVEKVIRLAEEEKAGMVVFKLDTPGGLVNATQTITQTIQNSRVPVAMWVPPGAQAASAGAFMMQAAHVAAMGSGAVIGAAHPVEISGGDVSSGDMKEKVVSNLLGHMRSLAAKRGRNQIVAQQMIMESISLTPEEALAQNVIDLIADDLRALIEQSRGREVEMVGYTAAIDASAERIEYVEMTLREQLVQFLSDPSIAYLLLTGGLLALFYEIITPGGFILGTTGAIMLLLGSIGLKMLPFNWAGVALVGAGVIVMGIDLVVGGMGILSLLGVAVLIAGGLFLFRAPGAELLSVSIGMMVGMAVTLGLCFTFFALMITKTLRAKVTTGQQGLIGIDVEITEDVAPEGMVKCRGEVWKARLAEGTPPLRKGDSAVVVATEGITLIIGPKN